MNDNFSFDALPWDVLVKVFSFLPPQEASETAAPVCRLFRDVAHSSDLWSEYVCSTSTSFLGSRDLLRHLGCNYNSSNNNNSNTLQQGKEIHALYEEVQSLRNVSYELVKSGVSCSSQDSEEQGIAATLGPEGVFWSSKGSPTPDADEWLVYRLREPISVVFSVSIEPYRALYQTGTPLYAPQGVSFSFGFAEGSWHYTTPVYAVDPREPVQRFVLAPQLCVGEFVRINLLGKRETQPSDNLYYTVLDRISFSGALWGALPKGSILTEALIRYGLAHNDLAQVWKDRTKLEKAMQKDAKACIKELREREGEREAFKRLISKKKWKELIIFLSRLSGIHELRSKASLKLFYRNSSSLSECGRAKTTMCSMLSADNTNVPPVWDYLCMVAHMGLFNPAESVAFLVLSKVLGNPQRENIFNAIYSERMTPSAELGELFFRLGMFGHAFDAYAGVGHFGKALDVLLHMKEYRRLVDFSVRSLFKPDWDAVIAHAAATGTEHQRLKLAFSLIFPRAQIHPPPGVVLSPEDEAIDEVDFGDDDEMVILAGTDINPLKVVGLPMAPVEVLSRLHIEMSLLNLLGDLQARIFATRNEVDHHPPQASRPPMSSDDLLKALDDYFDE